MKPIERVEILIKDEGISISAFEKKVGMSNNSIQTAIKRKANLKDDTLNSILSVYTDVSPEWLLTGKGSKYRDKNLGSNLGSNVGSNSKKTVDYSQPAVLSEPNKEYGNRGDLPAELFLQQHELLEERERTIYALNEVINSQKEAIQSQKDLINEYKEKLSLIGYNKPNSKTAG